MSRPSGHPRDTYAGVAFGVVLFIVLAAVWTTSSGLIWVALIVACILQALPRMTR